MATWNVELKGEGHEEETVTVMADRMMVSVAGALLFFDDGEVVETFAREDWHQVTKQ